MNRHDEPSRLAALREYGVLDTPTEDGFDRLTQLAAELFDAPIALVSLIDSERQWFKSRHGVDATETPRSWAFCDHAIRMDRGSILVVDDATKDPRFADNPLVTGETNIRFYAGAVLTNPEGANLGTLCVIDSKARSPQSEKDLARLRTLAKVVVDELELRRANRKLNEQRRMLELAERMSGVGHWTVDAATHAVTWSDEVFRIHGVTPETFSPEYDAAIRFYDPADQSRVDALAARALTTGEGFEFAMTLRRADGVIRDVVSRGDCQRDEFGKITGLVGVFQDVTEQNLAIQSVRESEQRYKLLADHVGDVISQRRFDGVGIYVSPAIHALSGYTAAEMVAMEPQDFVPADDLPMVLDAYAALRNGAEEQTIQFRTIHKQGHLIWVENRLRLIRDDQGRPTGVVGVIRDVTQRKRLEDELRLARIEAEAAAAAKSEFLANMSHELRTPLTSILGFADLAAAQPDLTPTLRHFVDRLQDASQSLLCLVNDILDFSKLEAGQVAILPKPTQPAALCRATLELLTPQAAAKDIDLEFDTDAADDLAVSIDGPRVRQVLLNLIGNAVKFTQAGRVAVKLSHVDAEALLVEVIDTGPGISDKDQARLFQRFSQIDGSLARQAGGTGLGLAICKGLIEAMGGALGVTSQVGQGSRFWFRIPALPASGLAESPDPTGRARPIEASGVRVLVADDHHANRDLARLILGSVGAEVTLVENGAEAVQLAEEQPYDVILLDLRMPVMDGPAACLAIRGGAGPNAHTPILAFTADADDQRLDLAPASGFTATVLKPIDSSALIAAVAHAAHVADPNLGQEQSLAG